MISATNRQIIVYGMWILLSLVITATVHAVERTEKLRIGGSGTDLATLRQIADVFEQENQRVKVIIPPSLGSSGGVKALNLGRLDIAATSRQLKPKEQKLNLTTYHYARTALVFATSISNNINQIDTEQLKAIYSGTHSFWPDGSVARPVLRPKSDSDTLIIQKNLPDLVSSIDKAYDRRGVPIAITDQDSVQKIISIPGAIGTSTLALILAEKRPLKTLTLNGIAPNSQSITNGSYKLVKDLYLVLPEKPSPLAKKFMRFISEQVAQHILTSTGHQVIETKYSN